MKTVLEHCSYLKINSLWPFLARIFVCMACFPMIVRINSTVWFYEDPTYAKYLLRGKPFQKRPVIFIAVSRVRISSRFEMHFYSWKIKYTSPPHPPPALNCFQDLAEKGESADLGTLSLKYYQRIFIPSMNPQIDVSWAHVWMVWIQSRFLKLFFQNVEVYTKPFDEHDAPRPTSPPLRTPPPPRSSKKRCH